MQKKENQEPIDAFLAYREGEPLVAEINDWLKQQGVRTHYFHDAVKPGDPIDESEALIRARSMVVFLGDRGWGSTQAKLVAVFQSNRRRIIPVLIGDASDSDKAALGGIFSTRLYLDLRELTEAGLIRLLEAIKRSNSNADPMFESDQASGIPHDNFSESVAASARVEQLLHILKDGSDRGRLEALKQIDGLGLADRSAFADVLRLQLTGPFAVGTEDNFAQAIRAPKRLASIRSWMLSALIQLDAEGSRDLILRHLDQNYESDRDVRFWTLAGIFNRNLSFEREAVVIGEQDHQPEIELLAHLMQRSGDPETVADIRRRLSSPNFERVWEVLRALRIVPVPELAPILIELLFSAASDTALGYDVLYALTSPPMAKAAAPLLLERWDPARVTREIVETAAGSAYQSGEHFVYLLSCLEPTSTLTELKRCLGDLRLRYSADQLLQQLRRLNEETASRTRHMPGFHSDRPGDTTDRLGIAAEARTFAAIMMARDVHPPLAIGLFGDWGSGKSFFMGEMQRQAGQLSDLALADPASPFCTQVAHIEFNAWHYADSNLWASLVSCILEKLHGKVSGLKTPAEEREELEREMVLAVQAQQKAVLVAEQATEELRRKNELLAVAEAERHQRPVSISEIRTGDWQRLIGNNAEAKKAIGDIAQRLGITDITKGVTDWQATLGELRSESELGVSLAKSVTTESRRPLWVALVLAVFIVPPLALLLHQMVAADNEWIVKLGAVTIQIAAMLTGSAAWVRSALSAFSERRKDLEAARNWVNQLLQAKRDEVPEAEKRLKNEVEMAQETKETADAEVIRIQALVNKLENAREEISLARFLSDRHKSDDYRKQLGIFTTIRRDFEVLVERLTPKAGQAQKLERIVLYIDDLDRCPADKVVEVLQAVHLLLAYPLFVVVVGVDSRWLLHSLSSHFKQFDDHVAQLTNGQKGDQSEHWTATPQHYLEKIFQIPYALRPMTDNGFSQMIDSLLAPSTGNAPPEADLKSVREVTSPNSAHLSSIQTRTTSVPATFVESTEGLASLDVFAGSNEPDDRSTRHPSALAETSQSSLPMLDESALTIQPWETEYAKRLRAFIPSPRAAKRFSNVYRILKAGVASNELQRFEGSPDFPGEFRLTMVLLAIQIYAPQMAAQWFPQLASQSSQERLDTALRVATDGSDNLIHGAMSNALDELLADGSMDLPIERAHHWVPIVSRFSFDLTHRRS